MISMARKLSPVQNAKSTGVSGAVSASNSLIGSSAGDHVGSDITALANGNYVVQSSSWNGVRA